MTDLTKEEKRAYLLGSEKIAGVLSERYNFISDTREKFLSEVGDLPKDLVLERPLERWLYVRGVFDAYVCDVSLEGMIGIICPNEEVKKNFMDWCEMPYCLASANKTLYQNLVQGNFIDVILFSRLNSIDFMYKMFKIPIPVPPDVLQDFERLISNGYRAPRFYWSRTLKEGIPPFKERMTDTGFDLHLVAKKKVKDGVYYYDTGISVQPEFGYYFEIVGRSSISKTGWMLANNVGVIDAGYTGSIIVALVRVVPDAPEIELPCKLVQMIPRKLHLMIPEESTIDETSRKDAGGLGSGQF